MDELKKALEEFKKEVLDKVKESKDASVERVTEIEKQLDEKIKASLESQIKERKISVPGLEDEKREFQLHKVVKAQLTGEWDEDSGFEQEVLKSNNAGTGEA